MNTGIQDAFNLGWKLALAAREHAPETLLDSYHDERHPIGKNLLRFTDRMFRLGSSDSWLLAQARRLVIPRAVPFVFKDHRRRARAFEFVSQLGIRYDWSPIVEEPRKRGALAETPGAGWRAPDAKLGETTLFEQMTGVGFHLLCFSKHAQRRSPIDSLVQRSNGLVTPIFIQHRGGPDVTALVDRDGEAFQRYGVGDAGFYLVRPDGYIATRAAGDDVSPIHQFMKEQSL